MTSTTRHGFDTTLDSQDICIEFDRVTSFGHENYGADADGNRGMWIDTIDDDYAARIIVTFYGEDGAADVEATFDELPAERQETVNALIEEWMYANEPEPPEGQDNDYPDNDDDLEDA